MPRTKKSIEDSGGAASADVKANGLIAVDKLSNDGAALQKNIADGKDKNGATTAKTAGTAPPSAGPVPAKRPLGAKEVIPFGWKVIGVSGDMILTLFKSIERDDADTHCARLLKDSNYTDLRVVEAKYKIHQSKSVKAAIAESAARAAKNKTSAAAKRGKLKKTPSKAKQTSKVIKQSRKKVKTTTKKTTKVTRVTSTRKKKSKKAAKKTSQRSTKSKKVAKKKTLTKTSKKKTRAKRKK